MLSARRDKRNPRLRSGERRTKRGKDAGRPNSSAIRPTEDAAPRRVRRRRARAGVSFVPPKTHRILPRLAVLACAGSLLVGALAGCSTTQEKAAKHQAEAQEILDARAERQAQKKKAKREGGKGSKPSKNGGKKQ